LSKLCGLLCGDAGGCVSVGVVSVHVLGYVVLNAPQRSAKEKYNIALN